MTNTVSYVQWVEPTSLAGTDSPSAPTLTDVALATISLMHMEVRIPPGHAGLTGLALLDSGTFVLPWSPTSPAWLIGDDDLLEYDFRSDDNPEGLQLGTQIVLATYNSGTYNHSWQVRMIYTPIGAVVDDSSVIVVPASAADVAALIAAETGS